jgi:hypothetical protein
MITVASIVSGNPEVVDFFFDSFRQHTPMFWRKDVAFLLVANDPEPDFVKHLENRKYNFVINRNPSMTEETMFKKGIAWPVELHCMYRAWNKAITESDPGYVLLTEMDTIFSPYWLENLVKHSDERTIVSPLVLERASPFPARINGTGAEARSFGDTPLSFRRDDFLNYVKSRRRACTTRGGRHFPCLLHRQTAIDAGLFPEGNIPGDDFYHVADYGDRKFFRVLQSRGIKHITAHDSIVYSMRVPMQGAA